MYIHMYVYVCVYIYIYIYIEREREIHMCRCIRVMCIKFRGGSALAAEAGHVVPLLLLNIFRCAQVRAYDHGA